MLDRFGPVYDSAVKPKPPLIDVDVIAIGAHNQNEGSVDGNFEH